MAIWKEVAGLCHLRSFLLFHRRENSFSESTQPLGRGTGFPFLVQSEAGGAKESPGSQASATPRLGPGVSQGGEGRLTRRPMPPM